MADRVAAGCFFGDSHSRQRGIGGVGLRPTMRAERNQPYPNTGCFDLKREFGGIVDSEPVPQLG